MSVISHIVRDYLQRRSMVLLLYSGLFFLLTLLAYSLAGDYGFGSFLLLFAILFVCAAVGLLYFDDRNGFARVLLHLPVDPGMVAKTHWVLMVGIPTVWVLGLTIAALLATSAGGRVSWLSVPLAVTLSFLVASFVFCLDAVRNSGRRFGGESAPGWVRLVVWALVAMASWAGVFVLAAQVGYYVNRNPRGLRPVNGILETGVHASSSGLWSSRIVTRICESARTADGKQGASEVQVGGAWAGDPIAAFSYANVQRIRGGHVELSVDTGSNRGGSCRVLCLGFLGKVSVRAE